MSEKTTFLKTAIEHIETPCRQAYLSKASEEFEADIAFLEKAIKADGKKITLSPSNGMSVNIFDLAKPNVTKELLQEKEAELRALLSEANKQGMLGTEYAIETLKDTSFLDAEPLWKEVAVKVLKEYATMTV